MFTTSAQHFAKPLSNIPSNFIHKIIRAFVILTFILLPLQTRYIFYQDSIDGVPFEPGTLSMYVIDVIIIALLFLFFVQYVYTRPPLTKARFFVFLFVLIFIFWALISLLFSVAPPLSVHGSIVFFLALVLFYAVATSYVPLRILAYSFLAGVVWSSLIGFFQFLSQTVDASTLLGIAYQSASELGVSVIESADGRYLRTYGSLSHPNILGGYITLGIVSTIFLYMRATFWRERIALISLIPFFIFVLITTGSRSAFLAGGVTCLFFLCSLFLIFHNARERFFVVKIGMILFASLFVFSFIFSDILLPRITADTRLEINSVTERIDSYLLWPRVIDGSFIEGRGLYTYRYTVALIDDFSHSLYEYQNVHSTYLLLIAEFGFIGLLMFLIFITKGFSIVRHSFWEHKKESLYVVSLAVSLFIIAFFDHYLWSTHFGLFLLFAIFGLMYRLSTETTD